MDSDDDLLTAEQAARALGITEKTMRKLIRGRLFPDSFPTSEGKRYWTRRDVRAYLHLRGRIGSGRLPPADEGSETGGGAREGLEK